MNVRMKQLIMVQETNIYIPRVGMMVTALFSSCFADYFKVLVHIACVVIRSLYVKFWLYQTPPDPKPHFFPFMLSGGEEVTELSVLYQHISETMVNIHFERAPTEKLLKIAEEWSVWYSW